ncbi:MAG: undecaprenyl-diphosphate phosphatase [Haloferacaceae archaeon]
MRELVVAVLAGIVQGIFEWLPISSQGNLALFLTAIDTNPDVALQLALFLHLGTTLSAATYYREDIREVIAATPTWRPGSAFVGPNATTTFVVVASLFTGVVGVPLYVFAVDFVGDLAGGTFVALIGALLVVTGAVQLASESASLGNRTRPTLLDSVLAGAFQGFAILPGVSRSGTTTSVLLFRSYRAPEAFRLSFLLSIPASLGGAALTVAGAGGLPGIAPAPAALALLTSAAVGYLTIDALMRIVERIPFWAVCFGLGGLAILGGGAVTWLGY